MNAPPVRILLTAADQTRAAFASVSKSFDSMKGRATALSGAITSAFAAIGAVHIVNSLDELNDLEKKTGIAAVKLGGIGFAAKQAGGDLQSSAIGIGKLNKTLAEAAAGSKDAAEPFKLLGINIKDAAGNTKGADQVLIELADSFAKLEDGPEKTALAVRIFGKAGADMIPLLDEGGKKLQQNITYYERYSKVTPEAVMAADEFNDTLVKLRLLTEAAGNEAVSRFLPVFQAIADQWVESKEKGGLVVQVLDLMEVALKKIALGAGVVVGSLTVLGKGFGAFFAAVAAAARGDWGSLGAIWEGFKADTAAAVDDMSRFETKLSSTLAVAGRTTGDFSRLDRGREKRRAPKLGDGAANAEAQAVLKKQLEQQLKIIEQAEVDQKLAIEFGNALAKSAYEDGLISLRERFAAEQEARDGNVRATTDALDKEIAALTRYKNNPAIKPQERIEAETKIGEATAKRALEVTKAAQADALAVQESRRLAEQLQDRYTELQASILDMEGKGLQAAELRGRAYLRDAARLVGQAEGDPALVTRVATLTGQLRELNDIKTQYANITGMAQVAEESLLLAAQEVGTSEIDTLRAVGMERRKALAQLDGLASKAAAVAAHTGNPADILAASQLALAFRRASAEADPLLVKTRDLGRELGDAAASGAEEAILHWQGFRKLLLGIGSDIERILLRSQFTKPLGDWLGNAIGGNGQASGGGGLLGRFLPGMFGSSSVGGLSAAEQGIANFAGFFADGGTLRPGQWGIAGENGPERIYAGGTALQVQANGGGAVTQVNHFHLSGPVDQRTQDQIARSAYLGAMRAQQRNG